MTMKRDYIRDLRADLQACERDYVAELLSSLRGVK